MDAEKIGSGSNAPEKEPSLVITDRSIRECICRPGEKDVGAGESLSAAVVTDEPCKTILGRGRQQADQEQ
jgi:hypothetical protein